MSKKVIGGELLHKDIAAISITPQEGAAQSIPLTLNASNTDFNINNSGGLLLPAGNVIKLSSADVDNTQSTHYRMRSKVYRRRYLLV